MQISSVSTKEEMSVEEVTRRYAEVFRGYVQDYVEGDSDCTPKREGEQ